jgi:O-antigen/teichoic acid export membrane protein
MYARMLLVMLITLFTVRVVLKTLGVEDYGIYNVVAGLVASVSFISTSMQMATQRFYAYAIGEKDTEKQKVLFNLSLLIYVILVVVIFILAETVGLWFLMRKMVIPESRFIAALWIYQFAILSFVTTILTVPFLAMIVAREDMGVYALISLIDCVLKLFILMPLIFLPYDKLIFYGVLILLVTIIKDGITVLYSRKNYVECKFKKIWDKQLFRSLLSYSGWSLFGSTAYISYTQGNNLLINIFFGPIANAAYTVAFQVSNALNMFASNFFMVVRPPLIKSYVAGNYTYMMRLFYMSSKVTFCLLLLIFLPLILKTDYILNLWLNDVSEYMVAFTRLTLVATIILSMHYPITAIIQAAAAVKRYHMIVETVTLLILPLTYIFYKAGCRVEYTFYVSICMFVIAHMVRIAVLRTVIPFSVKEYCSKFIFPIVIVTILSFAISFYVNTLMLYGLFNLIFTTIVSVVVTFICSFFIAISKQEREMVLKMIIRRNSEVKEK